MARIRFQATAQRLNGALILRLPETTSKALPSRGQVAAQGTVAGQAFATVIEPDGYGGHWMKVPDALQRGTAIRDGVAVDAELETTQQWPEPEVPSDFAAALANAPKKVQDKWHDITPMARWEWVRWINDTRNPQTRTVRIEKSISKLNGSHRRPCCFNLAACTDPELSKGGRLIESLEV